MALEQSKLEDAQKAARELGVAALEKALKVEFGSMKVMPTSSLSS